MQKRKIDELITHFNRKVTDMDIEMEYKMELLGMITAFGFACEKEFSVEPEPHWIPCSERLPHTNGVYNVTRKISDGFECRNISDSCYYDGANTWHDDTRVNHGRGYLTDVIAWTLLPEPYQGEGEEHV